MRSGQGAIGNGVAVDVEIAPEQLAGFQLLGGHDLAAVIFAAVVPLQRLAQPVVHADVEVHHHEHRRLQRSARSKACGGEFERFMRIFREQQHMLGVAMAGIGGEQDVRLLRARRHARRRTAALDVEHHGRHFGEIGEAEEFLHQRDAGARSGGEGARAVPAGADHHADGGDLVLRLHDGEVVLLGHRIDAIACGNAR